MLTHDKIMFMIYCLWHDKSVTVIMTMKLKNNMAKNK